MFEQVTPQEYLQAFAKNSDKRARQEEALKQAEETRKFEIELYWKRAAYFWTFIGAAFAAYFLLQKDRGQHEVTYVVASLGFFFSLAWHFVNRGSKFWQQNWEMHVDLLEDELVGPLYKTVLHPQRHRWWHPMDAYEFSVSKINHLLSFFVAVVWLVLLIRSLLIAASDHSGDLWTIGAITALTAGGIVMLGTATTGDPDTPRPVNRRLRQYRQ